MRTAALTCTNMRPCIHAHTFCWPLYQESLNARQHCIHLSARSLEHAVGPVGTSSETQGIWKSHHPLAKQSCCISRTAPAAGAWQQEPKCLFDWPMDRIGQVTGRVEPGSRELKPHRESDPSLKPGSREKPARGPVVSHSSARVPMGSEAFQSTGTPKSKLCGGS